MNQFNYFDKISDPTEIVLQNPIGRIPNFLTQDNSWQSLNITIDSDSFHCGMSYYNFVSQYVHKDIFNNDINRPVLENMLSCANSILSKLKVLEEIGIRISMFLAGGAMREIVNGKTNLVKDFDFFISFFPREKESQLSKENLLNHPKITELKDKYPEHLYFKCMEHYTPNAFLIQEQKEFEQSIIEKQLISQELLMGEQQPTLSHLWNSTPNFSWYLYIVNLADLLLQDFEPTLYSKANLLVNSHTYEHLIDDGSLVGVIKLKNLSHPCDIMFIENFVTYFADFDWEICKAGLTLYHPQPPNKMETKLSLTSFEVQMVSTPVKPDGVPFFEDIPTSAENCVSRFFSMGKFFEDIARKQLTYHVFLNPTHILHNEMSKRRKRLKQKYPDFQVVWNTQFLYNSKYKEADLKNENEILTIKTLMEESILEDLIPEKMEIKTKPLKF